MAKNETRRLAPALLKADKDAHAALNGVANYAPSNAKYKKETLKALAEGMKDAQDEEVKAEGLWKAARDKAAGTEWAFHNAMLGAKEQVVAQFGSDSDELQAMGKKKKSEYKKAPGRPRKQTKSQG